MSNGKQSGSRFVVDLGEIKLPKDVEKAVDLEIRKVALQAIAEIDFQGDLRITFPYPQGKVGDMHTTMGLVLKPPPPPPPPE